MDGVKENLMIGKAVSVGSLLSERVLEETSNRSFT